MLLALDVGNTNITMGVFDEENLVGTFRLSTQIARTSDEFGTLILDVLERNGIDGKKISDVIKDMCGYSTFEISAISQDIESEYLAKKYISKNPTIAIIAVIKVTLNLFLPV